MDVNRGSTSARLCTESLSIAVRRLGFQGRLHFRLAIASNTYRTRYFLVRDLLWRTMLAPELGRSAYDSPGRLRSSERSGVRRRDGKPRSVVARILIEILRASGMRQNDHVR